MQTQLRLTYDGSREAQRRLMRSQAHARKQAEAAKARVAREAAQAPSHPRCPLQWRRHLQLQWRRYLQLQQSQ